MNNISFMNDGEFKISLNNQKIINSNLDIINICNSDISLLLYTLVNETLTKNKFRSVSLIAKEKNFYNYKNSFCANNRYYIWISS